MDRNGLLPDRCVVCNADAGGHRVLRKLYWAPLGWKIFAWITPFVLLGAGIAAQVPWLVALFWPAGLLLLIAHTFVRKRFEVELGVCQRHRRMRAAMTWLSLGCLVALLVVPFLSDAEDVSISTVWILIGLLVLMGLAQSVAGVQAIAVKQLTDEHAWLARTGKGFRAALPELPS